ncbi:MAG: type II toxin-antitoxin system HicB family antitoxin [Phormidesmis sp.]
MNSPEKTNDKPLSFYMNLHYPVALYPEEDGGFTVAVMDLPGCVSQGKTVEEAVEAIAPARNHWLKTAYEHGDLIPLPSTKATYSGKTLLNMPPSLHRRLADGARREGVSLNQYIVTLLSQQNAFGELGAIQAKLDEIQQQLARKESVAYPSEKRAAQAEVLKELHLND